MTNKWKQIWEEKSVREDSGFSLKTLISLNEKCGANNELFELIDLILNEYSDTKKVSSTFVAKTGLNTNKE